MPATLPRLRPGQRYASVFAVKTGVDLQRGKRLESTVAAPIGSASSACLRFVAQYRARSAGSPNTSIGCQSRGGNEGREIGGVLPVPTDPSTRAGGKTCAAQARIGIAITARTGSEEKLLHCAGNQAAQLEGVVVAEEGTSRGQLPTVAVQERRSGRAPKRRRVHHSSRAPRAELFLAVLRLVPRPRAETRLCRALSRSHDRFSSSRAQGHHTGSL